MLSYGLIGTNGAGKSAVCDYLKTKGFTVISLSDIVREAATLQGLDHTRDNLVIIANKLKKEKGLTYLAEQVYKKAEEKNIKKVVFDSIRNLKEVLFLKDKGTEMIGIDADVKIRFKRISSRNRASDHIDFETFLTHDKRENEGLSSGQNIKEALNACNTIVKNEGTFEELKLQIDSFLNKN